MAQAVQPAGPSTGQLQAPRASVASREVLRCRWCSQRVHQRVGRRGLRHGRHGRHLGRRGGAGGAASGSMSGSAAGASGMGGISGGAGGAGVQPAGPSAAHSGSIRHGWHGVSQEELEALHQASEAWAHLEEQGVRRLASAAWAASPEEQEALRQASEAWAASREELEALRQALGAWAAYRVCSWGIAGWHGRHGGIPVDRWCSPGGMGGMGGMGGIPGGMGLSSLIVTPQRRYGATDCWMHDEHITILHGCVWQVWAKTHHDCTRKGGFM